MIALVERHEEFKLGFTHISSIVSFHYFFIKTFLFPFMVRCVSNGFSRNISNWLLESAILVFYTVIHKERIVEKLIY